MYRIGAYELGQCLGAGNSGRVYAARHRPSGRTLAAKVLHPGSASGRTLVRFQREVEAMAALHHPGILTVHDHGLVREAEAAAAGGALAAGAPWLVVDRAEASLADVPPPDGWPEVQHLLLGLLDALAHAHARGVVHCDLKPENVLLAPRMGRPSVLLADFGVAALADAATRGIAGTPEYMAPEQFHPSSRDLGPWSDLYAVGILAWELVTGALPYPTGPLERMRDQHARGALPPFYPRLAVPEGVEAWLRSLVVPDATRRPDAAAVVAEALAGTVPATRTRRPPPATWRATGAVLPPVLEGTGMALFGVRDLPVAGRTSERDALWAALLDVVSERKPRLVLLRGAPGVGTSRLARWLCERAAELGVARVLRVRGGPDPGLREWLVRHHRLEGLAQPDAERRLSDLGAPRPDRLAAVAAGEGDPVGAAYVVLRGLAAEGPVVLWLDDAGPEGRSLVRRLLATRHGPGLPILAVATARIAGEGWAALVAADGGGAVDVGPLPAPAMIELLAARVGVDRALASDVAARCIGNPAQALDLVRAWVERSSLAPGPHGHRLADPAERLPDDLSRRWVERIAGYAREVGPAGLAALRIAAVIGPTVEREVWASVVRAESLPDDEAPLGEAVRRGWLTEVPEGFRFTDGILRAALAKHLLGEQERRLHRACAHALGEVSGAARSIERTGRHRLAAGDATGAVAPLLQAVVGAWEADRLSELPELLELLGRALVAVPEGEAAWAAFRSFEVGLAASLGQGDETVRAFDRLVAAADRHGWWRRDVRVLAHAVTLARWFVPEPRIRAAVARVLAEHPRTAWAHRVLGLLAQDAGDYDEALARFGSALRAVSQPDARVGLVVDVACVYERLGRLEEAEREFREALATCERERVGDVLVARLNVIGTVGRRHGHAGVLDQARALVFDADEAGELRALAGASIVLLCAAAAVGDWLEVDGALLRLEHVLPFAHLADASVAAEVREAALRCAAAGETARAGQVHRLADAVGRVR